MEEKLKGLFDYQRYEKNEKLEKMIAETQAKYDCILEDEDLENVAAGVAWKNSQFDNRKQTSSVDNNK